MLAPAFADPARASQAVFRSVMDAMARPGAIVATGGLARAPQPLGLAAAAVALTLLDYDTLCGSIRHWRNRPRSRLGSGSILAPRSRTIRVRRRSGS